MATVTPFPDRPVRSLLHDQLRQAVRLHRLELTEGELDALAQRFYRHACGLEGRREKPIQKVGCVTQMLCREAVLDLMEHFWEGGEQTT